MQTCKRHFYTKLPKMGVSTIGEFPQAVCCQVGAIRHSLLKCQTCNLLVLLIEILDTDKGVLDWHYIPLKRDIEHRRL